MQHQRRITAAFACTAAHCALPCSCFYPCPRPRRWGLNSGRKWKGGRGPTASINFVTAHDGFTLADLVAYNEKHNDANGEQNRCGRAVGAGAAGEGGAGQRGVAGVRELVSARLHC